MLLPPACREWVRLVKWGQQTVITSFSFIFISFGNAFFFLPTLELVGRLKTETKYLCS